MSPLAGLSAKTLVTLLAATAPFAIPKAEPALPSAPTGGGWTTGSTGALGDVVYGPGAHVIDLATTGVYDPVNWRVVLDYVTLTVQAGATITFANHPTRAPVVMRASGDITIAGTLNLNGADGHPAGVAPSHAEPGPGGFRGGQGNWGTHTGHSAGLGPGGGFHASNGWGGPASHGSSGNGVGGGNGEEGPTYGSPIASPLLGGSGGGSSLLQGNPVWSAGGGAGGGSILVGSDSRITISGAISARGGLGRFDTFPFYASGHGSGGTIRLVAPIVELTGGAPPGTLDCRGRPETQRSGDGYVRIEVDGSPGAILQGLTFPSPPSVGIVLGEFLASATARVALVAFWDSTAGASGDWVPITQDPHARIFHPSESDVQVAEPGSVTFRIEGHDVPLGAPLHVRTTYTRGQAVIDSAHTMGEVAGSTLALSWTDVTLDLSGGVYALQVRAELP